MRQRKPADTRPYVGDYGDPIEGAGTRAAAGAGMVLLAIVIGFAVGFLVWALLWLSGWLTGLVWGGFTAGTWPWWAPIAVCAVAGLCIGLWTRFFGGAPESLEEVLGEVRRTGGYHLDSFGASIVGFLLPLVGGGSVGPEAGLTGIIAALCSWIGASLKRAGLKVKAVADLTVSAALTAIFGTPLAGIVAAAEDASFEGPRTPDPDAYTLRRGAKVVLYTAAAAGAVGGIAVLSELTGGPAGLPRFEAVGIGGEGGMRVVWFAACVIAGYILTIAFHAAGRAFGALGARFDRFTVLRSVLGGVVIGLVGTQLPDVLFSGEEQAAELMGAWTGLSAALLVATGLVKAVATPFCLGMGWRGGHFFPCIFAGISCGYGLALWLGADPLLCVTAVTATFVAGMTRKPLMALALLFLCFPVKSIVWLGLACVLGAAVPVPAVLLGARAPHGGEPQEGSGS